MAQIWHVRLFNGPILLDASGIETRRFRSHKVSALLAYLALNLDSPCPREQLYEALWPEDNSEAVANRFRVTLASLRRHLEPAGVPFGSIVDVSEPGRIRLRAETVTCDVCEFDRLVQTGQTEQAARLATGPLLPGFFEEWAVAEQVRCALALDDLPAPRSLRFLQQERPPQSLAVTSDPVPLPHFASSLPSYLTRFFGRDSERQELRELIQSHRLVSLIAMGGIGKTRLAAETIKNWEGAFVFVPLTNLPDAGRVYDTVLQALGVAPLTDCPTDEQLIGVLGRRGPLLLVIDNAEHLNDSVAVMALRLLENLPEIRLLVTSRQRLNIAGEMVYLLSPLEPPGISASPERLLEFSAVSLFVDRAKIARPDFTLSDRNAAAVVEICKEVEGIPLALELAAARITSQSPRQIAQSLQANLTELTSQLRGFAKRHQSLRAVIQGSLDLLTEEQRRFFLALSVFRGGWSMEAARSITGSMETEDHLEHLTVCSLIGVMEDQRLGTMRYSLLETLRQLAVEKLPDAAQAGHEQSHAHYYIDIVAHGDYEDFRFMDRLEADHENILLAMDWCIKHNRNKLLPFLTSILSLWANRGHHKLALDWIDRALPGEQMIAAAQESQTLIGFRVYVDVGRYDDAERVARALLGVNINSESAAWALNALGYIEMMKGDWDRAVAHQREATAHALSIVEERGRFVLFMCCSHTAEALNGRAEFLVGNPARQQDHIEAELVARTQIAVLPDNSRLKSGIVAELMRSLWGQQRFDEGDACLVRALEIGIAHRHLTSLANCVSCSIGRLADKGFPEQSVRLSAAVDALWEKMGFRPAHYISARTQDHLRELRVMLGEERFETNWSNGWYTPLEILIPSLLPQIRDRIVV